MVTMTPSSNTITDGQTAKFQELLGAALRKCGLPSGPTQQVLEHQGKVLIDEFITSLRKRVEMIGDVIIRIVSVNRTRTPQEALNATGRAQYTDASVVATMPRGKGKKVKIEFYKPGRYMTNEELEKDAIARGYARLAGPYELSAVNEADPSFADEHPNGTQWKNADGKWCFAAFRRWGGGRYLSVNRDDGDWYDYWWFAGVRK